MTVILPYVPGMLHSRTWAWAETFSCVCGAIRPTRRELDPNDDSAYWRLLAEEWQRSEVALFVIEQDMVPAPGVVAAMLGCPRPWCASPYTIGTGTWLVDGLGCTKFSARLKTRHPDLMERVGELADGGQPAKTWRRLDTRISKLLRELGYRPHAHRRSTHLHDYSRRP